jgi:hypothetical protein
MKNLYLIAALFTTTFIYSQVKQTNLISNGSFDTDFTGWDIENPDTNTPRSSGFDGTKDVNSSSGSGSLVLVKQSGKFLHIKQTVTANARKIVGDEGNYTMTFWIKTDAAYKRVKAGVYYNGALVYGTFTQNTVSDDNKMTRTSAANTWQKVTTTFALPSNVQVSFRIYPNSDGTTYHVDDISVKREITQELPATGGFSSGWGVVGSSTWSQDNGIYTLNTNSLFPKLVNFDNYVNADTSNKITLKLVNNSANNRLQIVHPRSNGTLRYVPVDIEPNTTATQTVHVLMEDSDDATVWSGEVGELTFLVKNWDKSADNGDGTYGAYIGVDQTGSIDFVEYSTSFTASLDDTLNNNIHIYPNPAQDFVYIDNANIDDNVNVFNVVGKRVMSFKIETENQAVDITDLKSGIYFLRLNNGQATKLLKK